MSPSNGFPCGRCGLLLVDATSEIGDPRYCKGHGVPVTPETTGTSTNTEAAFRAAPRLRLADGNGSDFIVCQTPHGLEFAHQSHGDGYRTLLTLTPEGDILLSAGAKPDEAAEAFIKSVRMIEAQTRRIRYTGTTPCTPDSSHEAHEWVSETVKTPADVETSRRTAPHAEYTERLNLQATSPATGQSAAIAVSRRNTGYSVSWPLLEDEDLSANGEDPYTTSGQRTFDTKEQAEAFIDGFMAAATPELRAVEHWFEPTVFLLTP